MTLCEKINSDWKRNAIFAGCAYVPVAAEQNKRQWIACDISIRAHTVLKRQFRKFNYVVDKDYGDHLEGISLAEVTTKSPHELPVRSDEDPIQMPKTNPLPEIKYKVPSSRIPESEMKQILLEISGYEAWCCGFANRKPDGTVIKIIDNFHLDHIYPKSQGGPNHIMYRAPLCQTHNILKKDRQITLEQLRKEIAKENGFHVNSEEDLINLNEARNKAVAKHDEWLLRKQTEH